MGSAVGRDPDNGLPGSGLPLKARPALPVQRQCHPVPVDLAPSPVEYGIRCLACPLLLFRGQILHPESGT